MNGWEQQRRARRILNGYDAICHICGRPGATIVDHTSASRTADQTPWSEGVSLMIAVEGLVGGVLASSPEPTAGRRAASTA